jgi:hypothetical protein
LRFPSGSSGHAGGDVLGRAGDELLALPVRARGIQLGRVVDTLLDREARRAVGFDVVCGDEAHRFLPLPTARIGVGEITIPSPLVLLAGEELNFYRSRTVPLHELRGAPVIVDGIPAGELRDVVIAQDGELPGLVVETGGRTVRIPYRDSVKLASRARPAA